MRGFVGGGVAPVTTVLIGQVTGWLAVLTSMWEFPKIRCVPYLGVLIIRILLFRVLY